MFSTGQLVFAGIFFVVFVAVVAYSYRKDIKLHKKYYRGTLYILLIFILFVMLLFYIKTSLNF